MRDGPWTSFQDVLKAGVFGGGEGGGAGQGLKEVVHCYMTAFGGRGWDLFRDVMHMHVSKAKRDGKEHSESEGEKKKGLKLLGQHNSRPKSI